MRFGVVLLTLSALVYKNESRKLPENDVPVTHENNSPIIGVLSQEISYYLNRKYPGQYKSFIAASYVKFVEGGGARVVPIWIDQPREYYEELMTKINGILLPGGATWFNQTKGYAEAGQYLYEIATEMNKNGVYMPIWGTCLGFELLTYLAAGNVEYRAHCNSMNQALPLEFKNDFRESRLFQNAPAKIVKILQTESVTANFHQFCVTEQNMTLAGLNEDWRVMSLNRDWNGLEFISTIEHKRYPFYGVQFHPEKNLYEWVKNKNITHTANAIRASQYFAQFLVDEARMNGNRFSGKQEEYDYLIYNFSPTFTGRQGSSFIQSYLFASDVSYGGISSNIAINGTNIDVNLVQ